MRHTCEEALKSGVMYLTACVGVTVLALAVIGRVIYCAKCPLIANRRSPTDVVRTMIVLGSGKVNVVALRVYANLKDYVN